MKLILPLLALAIVTCSFTASTSLAQSGLKDLEGTINIDGSSTAGTGGGFKRFTKGETDISDASRPIKYKEFESCKANGVSFMRFQLPMMD